MCPDSHMPMHLLPLGFDIPVLSLWSGQFLLTLKRQLTQHLLQRVHPDCSPGLNNRSSLLPQLSVLTSRKSHRWAECNCFFIHPFSHLSVNPLKAKTKSFLFKFPGPCAKIGTQKELKYIYGFSPDWCGSVGWVLSPKPKGHWIESHSGHMPGLWARSLVGGVQEAAN